MGGLEEEISVRFVLRDLRDNNGSSETDSGRVGR